MCEFCGDGPVCCVCGRGLDPATPENAGERFDPKTAAAWVAEAEAADRREERQRAATNQGAR